MKIGIEVEGRLKGVKTLFMECEEVDVGVGVLAQHPNIGHVYISDLENKLDLNHVLAKYPNVLITVERTAPRPQGLPSRLVYMLSLPYYDSVNSLLETDMVKFDKDQHVLILPKSAEITTRPEDFLGDVEL